MNPFLDVSTLTDEQIIEKLGKAYTYLYDQSKLGHNPTVQSIRVIIRALEEEKEKRYQKMMDDEFKRKNPKDLDPIELGKLQK